MSLFENKRDRQTAEGDTLLSVHYALSLHTAVNQDPNRSGTLTVKNATKEALIQGDLDLQAEACSQDAVTIVILDR